MPEYNLIEKECIPCILFDGTIKEFGLFDVLVKAHDIKELSDSSPLVTIALHRLLLAILHRNFGPSNLAAWQELWGKKKWDEHTLSNYFSIWEHRFNLFDSERPFYQVPEMDGAEKHPIIHLALEAASGNNATLFDHNSDSIRDAISSAEAARYLIATQAYAIGGGNSQPFNLCHSPLTKGRTVMVLGDSLFETLALNLVVYNTEVPVPHMGTDLPIWESDNPVVPDKNGSITNGYLDYLTWQSRRVHLIPEDDNSVRECQIQQHLKLHPDFLSDPFKDYRKNDKGWSVELIYLDKAIWRDSHSLFQVSKTHKLDILEWLGRIEKARRLGTIEAKPAYRIVVTGLSTDARKAASVLLWRHERLPLPLEYLDEEYLVDALKGGLDLAENVGKLLEAGFILVEFQKSGRKKTINIPGPLMVLAKELLPKDQNGKADSGEMRKLADSLSPSNAYWASLGTAFPVFMVNLAKDINPDEKTYGGTMLPVWAKEIRKAARNAFTQATGSLDRTGRSLKAVSIAQREFDIQLHQLLSQYLNDTKGGEQ